jgi:hypothetical protein
MHALMKTSEIKRIGHIDRFREEGQQNVTWMKLWHSSPDAR